MTYNLNDHLNPQPFVLYFNAKRWVYAKAYAGYSYQRGISTTSLPPIAPQIWYGH